LATTDFQGEIALERPFIHINCASTLDGKIAMPDGLRLSISTAWDKTRVHRLRANLGAVLVGAGTIAADDPKLTVNPEHSGLKAAIVKIVIDGMGRISAEARFLRTEGCSLIVTSSEADPAWIRTMEDLAYSGIGLDIVSLEGGPDLPVPAVWSALKEKGIKRILVEGGSDTIARILGSGQFDLLTVFYAPMAMGGSGPSVVGGQGFPEPLRLDLTALQVPPGGGILAEYRPQVI
jgi:diaminohydroxyphosphoribosylaminopyrimidine deaminase / 5-amino-6-(5-phosphoribosylamino)uracil reductase